MVHRISRYVLRTLGVLLALAVVALGSMYAYAATDKTDTFYLVDAQPLDPDYLFKLDHLPAKHDDELLGHRVHRLKPGGGLILAYRFYSNGSVTVVDDEVFSKITVWLPNGAPPTKTRLDLADRAKVLVMVSSGGSAWPRAACSGYVSTGSLDIERKSARYQVSLHGQSAPHGNARHLRECRPSSVDVQIEAKEIQFGQMTPWLGSPGGHPYTETYR